MMTSAQVVETLVNVTSNSPSQDHTHTDDHNLATYDTTPGFKPFTDKTLKLVISRYLRRTAQKYCRMYANVEKLSSLSRHIVCDREEAATPYSAPFKRSLSV